MHSSSVRIQNVFGFFTTVAFTVAAAIAVSVLLCPQAPSASLEMKNVKVAKGRAHYFSTKREEFAHITFDLDADLSSLFNWNTKQIFVYITASYPAAAAGNPRSEAVVWDAIIPADSAPFHANTYVHPSASGKSATASKGKSKASKKRAPAGKPYPEGARPGIVRLAGQKPKYQITDATGKMAERADATLTLHWNVQPWVGVLTWTNRRTLGLWQGLKGGTSAVFAFPSIKGSETLKKEDLKTATGAERNRGKPA